MASCTARPWPDETFVAHVGATPLSAAAFRAHKLTIIPLTEYSIEAIFMAWDVEHTDLFSAWWAGLTEKERESVDKTIYLLENVGPQLPYPYSSQVKGSQFGRMRELRIQHAGRPFRVLYIFDPMRTGILLLGGDKTGKDRWYAVNIPRADALYRAHLARLDQEGVNDGEKIFRVARADVTRITRPGRAGSQRSDRGNGALRIASCDGFFAGRSGNRDEREATERRKARAANGHVRLHAA
jgi:hypothetical protein